MQPFTVGFFKGQFEFHKLNVGAKPSLVFAQITQLFWYTFVSSAERSKTKPCHLHAACWKREGEA